MSVYARTQRIVIRLIVAIFGTAVVAMGVLVFIRLMVHTTPAEAASVIYYPNFCLGGWKYPQHASGPAAVTGDFDPDKFNGQNSAYLESSVASQLFCGYFSVKNAKNPPTKAVISFNWLFAFPDSAPTKKVEESFTSTSTDSVGISPATGFTVSTSSPAQQQSPAPSTPTSQQTSTNNTPPVATSSTQSSDSGTPSTTTDVPLIPNPTTSTPPSDPNSGTTQPSTDTTTNSNTTTNNSTGSDNQSDSSGSTNTSSPPTPTTSSNDATAPVAESVPATVPAPEPAPVPAPAPEPAPAPAPAPSGDAPQSSAPSNLGSFLASLIAEKVHAAEPTIIQSPISGDSFKDFLEVSYSLDGIRWTSIGRVNRTNWKDYKVEIPVNSWDEVKRLQVMVSVLPTIDEKPDIYLDNISMKAEYKQTTAELAAAGFAAVSNAVDSLIGDGNDAENSFDIVPDEKKPPQVTEIYKKKLIFSASGSSIPLPPNPADVKSEGKKQKSFAASGIVVTPSADGTSFKISGKCTKPYFVILTYRNQTDYYKKSSSYVANEAHECVSGHFSYDMSSLSPDLRGGLQYLLIAEQDETNPWVPISDLYPITIEATTTVERIYQDQ